MSISDEALSRLGQFDRNRIAEVIGDISDSQLRKRIAELLGKAMLARQLFAQVDIKPFEAAPFDINGYDIWKQLAPQYGEAFRAISDTLDTLNQIVPPPAVEEFSEEDLDLAFSETDLPLTPGEYSPPLDTAPALDGLIQAAVQQTPAKIGPSVMEKLGDTSWAISSMLRDEMQHFGGRMRQAAVVNDRWNLLAELQETRHKLIKGIDALMVGICSCFAKVKRDEVIPGFHSELSASLELRSLIFDLRDRLRRARARFDVTPQLAWRSIASEVFAALENFVFGPVFGWLRALDKREVIQFRKALRDRLHDPEASSDVFLEPIEGALRFLEALEVINQREILKEHDRQMLGSAADHLLKAASLSGPLSRQEIAAALADIAKAQGRDQTLDEMVAAALDPLAPIDPARILGRVREVLASV